jgi:hypothetical protein
MGRFIFRRNLEEESIWFTVDIKHSEIQTHYCILISKLATQTEARTVIYVWWVRIPISIWVCVCVYPVVMWSPRDKRPCILYVYKIIVGLENWRP